MVGPDVFSSATLATHVPMATVTIDRNFVSSN